MLEFVRSDRCALEPGRIPLILPDDGWRDAVTRLLQQAPALRGYAARAEYACEVLAGTPYQSQPLGGGPGLPEELRLALHRFDCVTFMETVAALGAATDSPDFADKVRLLRYDGGVVDYFRRRHYMSAWIEGNVADGRVTRVEPGEAGPPRIWLRTLTVLPELGLVPARIRGWPKRSLPRLRPHLASGDLVFFISTRADLDYFHTGVLGRRGNAILLAHAARSRGGVVMEPLAEFLRRERMSGLTVVRPWPGPGGA